MYFAFVPNDSLLLNLQTNLISELIKFSIITGSDQSKMAQKCGSIHIG